LYFLKAKFKNDAKVLTFNTSKQCIHWLTKCTTLAKCLVTNTYFCVLSKVDQLIIASKKPNSKPFLTQNYCTQSNNPHCIGQCENILIQIMHNFQSNTDTIESKMETINSI
jgi:hypothetical protein